jgi:hypothetical protein
VLENRVSEDVECVAAARHDVSEVGAVHAYADLELKL